MGSTGAKKSSSKSAFSFEGLSKEQQLEKVKELQNAMGQNGNEAGNPNASPNDKLYANTGKAFNINTYLMTDGETFQSPDAGDWNWIINKNWVENAIPKIDAGMKPLPEALNVTRYIDADALGKMTGLTMDGGNFNHFLNMLQNDAGTGKMFTTMLKGLDYTHKGYTSTTYLPKHGAFDNRDVKLEIVLNKNTNAIVTNNHKEHEILAGRNSKYNFNGNWRIETTSTGKKQLVLQVSI